MSTPRPSRSRAQIRRLHRRRHQVDGAGRHRRRGRAASSARPTRRRDFDVVSNPEFLREGSAIDDFMRPDRVVDRHRERARARGHARALPPAVPERDADPVHRACETAELIKYAANAFLAMKITFINEIADLCEKVGADVHDVARGIGLDGRIGTQVPASPGPGYGGSCFPKDTLALVKTARDAGAPSRLDRDRRSRSTTRASAQMVEHDRRRARRLGRGQDGRGPRPHLQAEHRRHARRARAVDHPAAAGEARRQGAAPTIPKAWTRRKKLMPDVDYRERCLRRDRPAPTRW